MPEERPDTGFVGFPITFRGYDPEAVRARILELEAQADDALLLDVAVARSEARLAELDTALALASDPSVSVEERSDRLAAALDRLRQAVDEVRRLRSSA